MDEVHVPQRDATIVTRDGVRLSVRDKGIRNARKTVVLLHGLCLSKDTWDTHGNFIASDGDTRVISYDHRGHGKSSSASIRTYTVEQLALDLAAVLEWAQPNGPVTLAGHSMGGMTILAYLGLHSTQRPVAPDNLLLVATAAGRIATRGIGSLLNLPFVSALSSNAGMVPDKFLDPLVRRVTSPVVTRLVKHVGYTEDRDGVQASSAAWSINATPIRTKLGFINALRMFDAYHILPSITARTTILSGGKDFLTPRAHADDIASAIRGAKHIHFPENGHMLLHEVESIVTSHLIPQRELVAA